MRASVLASCAVALTTLWAPSAQAQSSRNTGGSCAGGGR
jgi:hypothetical protein